MVRGALTPRAHSNATAARQPSPWRGSSSAARRCGRSFPQSFPQASSACRQQGEQPSQALCNRRCGISGHRNGLSQDIGMGGRSASSDVEGASGHHRFPPRVRSVPKAAGAARSAGSGLAAARSGVGRRRTAGTAFSNSSRLAVPKPLRGPTSCSGQRPPSRRRYLARRKRELGQALNALRRNILV
jgi:hypothetical protein